MPPMTPATDGAQYRVPPEPSRWPAIALAVTMHAMLLGFLWIGISWQNNEPVTVEAEVWDMQVQSAAPPPPPPPEVAEPEPRPEPEPVPVPKVAPPPAVEQPVAPRAPDIALEREREREKREQLKKDAERRELAEQKKRDDAKRELAEQKKRDDAKRELDEKKQRDADKKLKEQDDKKKADKLAAADKKKADAAKAKEAAAEQAKIDKLRDAEMKRMLGAVGTTGSAAKSTAPRNDASYQAALTAKIKSTTTYAGSTDVSGNPRAEFRIEQLPTGEIISVKKVKSSGVPSFDDAVEKGIIKSSPLPKKKDGTVERSVLIGFSMKDLD
jgi:colicin import membrane protein